LGATDDERGCTGGEEVGIEEDKGPCGRGLKGTAPMFFFDFNTGRNLLDFSKMKYYEILNFVLTKKSNKH
jgi:hypothetical protein